VLRCGVGGWPCVVGLEKMFRICTKNTLCDVSRWEMML
jgi:hypothetical protein